MVRLCPNCKASIARVAPDRAQRANAKWYRFSYPRFYCPKCNVEIRPITRPIGHALQLLNITVVMGAMLLAEPFVIARPWLAFIFLGGLFCWVALMRLWWGKSGFIYVLAKTET